MEEEKIAPSEQSAPVPNNAPPAQNAGQGKGKGAGLVIIIVVLAVIILAAGGYLAWWYLIKNKGTSTTSPAATSTVTPVSSVTASASATITVSATISASASSEDYIIADSNTRIIAKSEIMGLTPWQLKVARNEIYARHGREFVHKDLQCYFATKSWYKVDSGFSESDLSTTENKNVATIQAYEEEIGSPLASTDSGCGTNS
ncbi:MAG: YARHG domain-containing protein [Candidatus Berkelbacteria bacterium]|nr:YARHG domain-containing protein [Candidatus Berkelbacteria bacterium]